MSALARLSDALVLAGIAAAAASGLPGLFAAREGRAFERFAAVPSPEPVQGHPFEVVLNSCDEVLQVPADKSILRVLQEAGRDVDWGCSEGVCGTCITDVLAGEIEHRDSILNEDERRAGDCMCLCVSRARGDRLVLDL